MRHLSGSSARLLIRVSAGLMLIGATASSSARAQDAPLASFLPRVIIESARVDPSRTGVDRSRDFIAGITQNVLPVDVNRLLALQIATFPTAPSSPTLMSVFDRQGTTSTPLAMPAYRAGPIFGEWADTIGSDGVNIAVAYTTTGFTAFEGGGLDDDELVFTLDDRGRTSGARDRLRETLSLDVTRREFLIAGTYGVTNRLDVGVVVPIAHVSLRSRVTSRIFRNETASNPGIHSFDGVNEAIQTRYDSGSATGFGDLRVRATFALTRWTGGGLAAGADLRMPTGDANDLLGLGAWQTTVQVMGSRDVRRYTLHGGAGYTFSGGELNEAVTSTPADVAAGFAFPEVDRGVPNELRYTAGIALPIASRVSAGFDVHGRRLFDVSRFTVSPVQDSEPTPTVAQTGTGALDLIVGVAGLRVAVTPALLFRLNVLLPLSNAGLKPGITPTIALEHAF